MQQQLASEGNPASSFEAGLISANGVPFGMCIKFRMFDGSDVLQHYPMYQFNYLMQELRGYINEGRHTGFMFRAGENPSLVESLDPRHPYHTITTEIPNLSQEEIGAVTKQSVVTEIILADRGPTLVLRTAYEDGTAEIPLHEYTAFSLYGYLEEFLDVIDKLSGASSTQH